MKDTINIIDEENVSRETLKNDDAKPKRTRAFALQCYDKRDDLVAFLSRTPWIQHWALCTHDKDVWTKADEKEDSTHKEGTLKGVHTHVLIYTYEAKTSTAIRKNFARFSKEINPDNPQNTLCQVMNDTVKMWRYLRHLDNPEKYPYTEEERICDDKTHWTKYEKTDGLNDVSRNTGFAMYQDLLNGTSTKDMILRYGKEYIYHAKHFKEVLADTYHDETQGARLSCDSYVDQYMLVTTATILRNQLNPKDYPPDFLLHFEKALLQALNSASLLDEYFVYISKTEK